MSVIPPIEAYRGQQLVARDDHDPHDLTDMFQTDSHVIRIVGGSLPMRMGNDYQETEQIREKERKRRHKYDAERAKRVNAEMERRRKAMHDIRALQAQNDQQRREYESELRDQDLVEKQLRKQFDELDAEYERLEKIKQEKGKIQN